MAIVSAGAGVLSALSPNYIWLVVLRWMVGIGLGGGHVFSSWFLEFVPTANRGTWMIVFSTFWSVGTVLEAAVAWVCKSSNCYCRIMVTLLFSSFVGSSLLIVLHNNGSTAPIIPQTLNLICFPS